MSSMANALGISASAVKAVSAARDHGTTDGMEAGHSREGTGRVVAQKHRIAKPEWSCLDCGMDAPVSKFGIGQPVRRVEDRRFITGRGSYVDDIVVPGQCHGVVLMSPHAHARIKHIKTSKAAAAPGVLCVLTG